MLGVRYFFQFKVIQGFLKFKINIKNPIIVFKLWQIIATLIIIIKLFSFNFFIRINLKFIGLF